MNIGFNIMIDRRIIRLTRFEKINNAQYYLFKKYYNCAQNPASCQKLCSNEDLIIDDSYNTSAHTVTYVIEAYNCNGNILNTQKFINGLLLVA